MKNINNTAARQTTGAGIDSISRNHMRAIAIAAMLACSCLILASAPAAAYADEAATGQLSMFRLYNPNSGEHFYTASSAEREMLEGAGWNYEGVDWVAPESSNTPVYRMYNENGGEHHYTTSEGERDALINVGWSYEGIGWYSDDMCSVSLHRDYNPNAFSNNHNYTTSSAEHEMLMSAGWRDEGRAWYGVAPGNSGDGAHEHFFKQHSWGDAYRTNTGTSTRYWSAELADAAYAADYTGYNYGFFETYEDLRCSCGQRKFVIHGTAYNGEIEGLDHLCSYGAVNVFVMNRDGGVATSSYVATHSCPTCGGVLDYSDDASYVCSLNHKSLKGILKEGKYSDASKYYYLVYKYNEDHRWTKYEISYDEFYSYVKNYAAICGW